MNISPQTEPLWTVDEVAQYLKLQPDTIRSMARDRRMPATKVGKAWRFRHDQIKEWINKQKNMNQD